MKNPPNFDWIIGANLQPYQKEFTSTLLSFKSALSSLDETQKSAEEREKSLNSKLTILKKSNITSETWIHLRIPHYYVQIEVKYDQTLKDHPVVIASNDNICQVNDIAFERGVRISMNTRLAFRICPKLVCLRMNLEKYRRESEEILEYLKQFDEAITDFDIGEASLWVTSYLPDRSAFSISEEIIDYIQNTFGLKASAGIGCNKLIASLASNSKLKIQDVPDKTVIEFMRSQPLGIPILAEVGINTYGDFLKNKVVLSHLFSESVIISFFNKALGIGQSFPLGQREYISVYRAFPSDKQEINVGIFELCKQLSNKLVDRNVAMKEVVIIVQTYPSGSVTDTEKFDKAIQSYNELYSVSRNLYRNMNIANTVKVIKICAFSFEEKNRKNENLLSVYKKNTEIENVPLQANLKRKCERVQILKKAKFTPLFTFDKYRKN